MFSLSTTYNLIFNQMKFYIDNLEYYTMKFYIDNFNMI